MSYTQYNIILENGLFDSAQSNIELLLVSIKMVFVLYSSNLNCTVQAKSFNILREDYSKILLKLYCKDCAVADGCLKLKFNIGSIKLCTTFS